MTPEEMIELILLAQENEELYMPRAVRENEGAIVTKLNASRVSGLTRSDIKTSLKIATIKAIRKFDASKGFSWSTFLYRYLDLCIKYLIKTAQSKQRWRVRDAISVELCTLAMPITVDKCCVSMDSMALMHAIDLKEAVMMELYYIYGLTYREIGRVFGCTGERVRQRIHAAFAVIRKSVAF